MEIRMLDEQGIDREYGHSPLAGKGSRPGVHSNTGERVHNY